MGKIIFSTVHPELLSKIQSFCSERGLPSSTFEDLSAGLNHAEIGALIAEKWNFPEGLVNSIRHHHDPSLAPLEYRDLVDTVYLANMFCEFEQGNVNFEQFDAAVLENFSIKTKKQVDTLLEKFIGGFARENQNTR
jgi:HD-like signal output (HDOD) protein